MLDYIEIASALVITFSLLLLLFGVLWAPFAALVTARVASARDMASGRMAEAGAKWSLPFFFPWIYLLLRILGKRVPDKIVVGAYILMYLAVLLGPILFNVLLAGVIFDIQSNFLHGYGEYASLLRRTPSFVMGLLFAWPSQFTCGAYERFSSIFWIISLLASAAVFSYVWARSLHRLSSSYLTAGNTSAHIESGDYDLLGEIHLAPLRTASRILRYWLLSLFVFKFAIEGCISCCSMP